MFPYALRVIIHPDEGLVEKHMNDGTIRKGPGSLTKKGYMVTRIDGKNHYMHQVVWRTVRGAIPEGQEIDHVNGDRTDNRLSNLRAITHKQNTENRREQSNSGTGVKGVCWDKARKRFKAQITHEGVNHQLGRFTTIGEAQRAYAGAAALIHTYNPHAAP